MTTRSKKTDLTSLLAGKLYVFLLLFYVFICLIAIINCTNNTKVFFKVCQGIYSLSWIVYRGSFFYLK